ncbi:MAG: peroxide stress protein YaaA [Arenicellales bacterium]
MIITLSPSKGQDFDTPAPTEQHSMPRQLDQSQLLIDAIKSYDVEQIRAMMSVSENIASLNVDRFQSFNTPFNLNNSKQALFAFKGDVYSTIDVNDYSKADLDFAQNHLRILSGLYGYLRPLDLMQAYRLEMKTKLSNPRGENLYTFWGERITELLNSELKTQTEPTLVNLASNEYFKSIKPKLLAGRLLNISFKETKDDKTRVIAIFAKRARGLMANWLIQNKIEHSEEIKNFSVDGYRFNQNLSDDSQWTFSRLQPAPKPK